MLSLINWKKDWLDWPYICDVICTVYPHALMNDKDWYLSHVHGFLISIKNFASNVIEDQFKRSKYERSLFCLTCTATLHNNGVLMDRMASQITSLTIVNCAVYSGADKKNNSKAPRHWPLCGEFTEDRWIPLHKWPVTRKMFPFDDVIMIHVWGRGINDIAYGWIRNWAKIFVNSWLWLGQVWKTGNHNICLS